MPATTEAAPFSRVPAKTALEICKVYKPGQKALELLGPGLAPRPFFELLLKRELWVEAARFLAQALPKREAVWWACTCVRQAIGAAIPPVAANALAAAEKWVAGPSEENRRAVHAVAQVAQGMDTPAGCLAMAAFWSGGSLAAPDQPLVPAPDNLTGTAVTGALIQAALLNQPEKFADTMRQFLNVGVNTAAGSNRWKESAVAPAR